MTGNPRIARRSIHFAVLLFAGVAGVGVARGDEPTKSTSPSLADAAALMAKGDLANQQKAFVIYKKAADAGDAQAALELGKCYQKGIGVSKDRHKAVAAFKQSAAAGNVKAMTRLGEGYISSYKPSSGAARRENRRVLARARRRSG